MVCKKGVHRHDSPSVPRFLSWTTYHTNLDHFHLCSCLVFLVLFLPSQGVRGILVSESHPQFPRQISFCAVVFSSLKSQILRPVERFGSFFVLIPSQRHQSPSRTGSDAPLQTRFRWFFPSGHCSALFMSVFRVRDFLMLSILEKITMRTLSISFCIRV